MYKVHGSVVWKHDAVKQLTGVWTRRKTDRWQAFM